MWRCVLSANAATAINHHHLCFLLVNLLQAVLAYVQRWYQRAHLLEQRHFCQVQSCKDEKGGAENSGRKRIDSS